MRDVEKSWARHILPSLVYDNYFLFYFIIASKPALLPLETPPLSSCGIVENAEKEEQKKKNAMTCSRRPSKPDESDGPTHPVECTHLLRLLVAILALSNAYHFPTTSSLSRHIIPQISISFSFSRFEILSRRWFATPGPSLLHLIALALALPLRREGGTDLAQLGQGVALPRDAGLEGADLELLVGDAAVEVRQRGLDEGAGALEAVLQRVRGHGDLLQRQLAAAATAATAGLPRRVGREQRRRGRRRVRGCRGRRGRGACGGCRRRRGRGRRERPETREEVG